MMGVPEGAVQCSWDEGVVTIIITRGISKNKCCRVVKK